MRLHRLLTQRERKNTEMSDPRHSRHDMTPYTAPVAWSQDPASDEMPTVHHSPDVLATMHAGDGPVYLPEQDLGSFDEPPPLPWYRHPVVLVAAAASAVVVAAVIFVMTSHTGQVGTVPFSTIKGSTQPSTVPRSSLAPPPNPGTAPSIVVTNQGGGENPGPVTYPSSSASQNSGATPSGGATSPGGTTSANSPSPTNGSTAPSTDTGTGSTPSASPGSSSSVGPSPGKGFGLQCVQNHKIVPCRPTP
jgi:hypothetical protein